MSKFKSDKARSWFCVLNNPEDSYPEMSPEEIVNKVADEWIQDKPTRSCAVLYCISAEGLKHLHMVLEDSNQARFSSIKSTYDKAHIEPTMGNRSQVEDYINKRGAFAEKGETIIISVQRGEIVGAQGKRSDLDRIDELLHSGYSPEEIFRENIRFRRYEKIIRDAYYSKRIEETPFERDLEVIWAFGESGTGKSYFIKNLLEEYGVNDVYVLSDYQSGFDKYSGQNVLVLEEFRGNIIYSDILKILDVYKQQVHARYSNIWTLWSIVYITSPLTPFEVYSEYKNNTKDTLSQLHRRITKTVFCYKDIYGNFCRKELSGARDRGDFGAFARTEHTPFEE